MWPVRKRIKIAVSMRHRVMKIKLSPKPKAKPAKWFLQAEAYAQARIERAKGDAERFKAMLLEYRKAKNVTKKRLYIEAMEDVLPGIQKYIIKTDKGSNVLNVLPFDKLAGARRSKMNTSSLYNNYAGCTCPMGYKQPFSLSMKQSRPSYCNLVNPDQS
jgi:hypothetical protein